MYTLIFGHQCAWQFGTLIPPTAARAVHDKVWRREKLEFPLPVFVAWYNFARKHETLKGQTPAMASVLTDHVWTIKELIERAAT